MLLLPLMPEGVVRARIYVARLGETNIQKPCHVPGQKTDGEGVPGHGQETTCVDRKATGHVT